MTRGRLALGAGIVLVVSLLWFTLAGRTRRSVFQALGHKGIKVGFQVGEYAPDFELHSVGGGNFRLSALRGQPVVVNFWGTWCAPCKVEIPWLVQLDQTYRAQGVRIVGVAMESGSVEEITKFARERNMEYLVVLGNSATAEEYGGVRFIPQSFFIDRDGRIIKTATGLTDKKDLEDGIKALLEHSGKSQAAPGD